MTDPCIQEQADCLVEGAKDKRSSIKAILGAIAAVAAMSLSYFRESPLFGLLGAALGAFAFLSGKTVHREYEYLLSGDTLSVDVIYGKRRRRTLVIWNTENICLFAPEDHPELETWRDHAAALHDFSSSDPGAHHWCSVCRKGERITVSRLTPNAAMLAALRKALPLDSFRA